LHPICRIKASWSNLQARFGLAGAATTRCLRQRHELKPSGRLLRVPRCHSRHGL